MHLRPLARAKAPVALDPPLTGAAAWRCAALVLAACLAVPAARAQAVTPAAAASTPKAAVSRPLWVELKVEQQEALRPLAPHWDGLSEGHKRKWLALSRNYASMKPEGQATLHSRMSDWASLSFHQRAQARLNFAEIQRMATDERKSKWEAYQALSEDERDRLAKRAGPRSPGAAVALQPVPAQKLAPIPAVAPAQRQPRIQLGPPPAGAQPPKTQGAPVPAEAQVPAPEAPAAPQ